MATATATRRLLIGDDDEAFTKRLGTWGLGLLGRPSTRLGTTLRLSKRRDLCCGHVVGRSNRLEKEDGRREAPEARPRAIDRGGKIFRRGHD